MRKILAIIALAGVFIAPAGASASARPQTKSVIYGTVWVDGALSIGDFAISVTDERTHATNIISSWNRGMWTEPCVIGHTYSARAITVARGFVSWRTSGILCRRQPLWSGAVRLVIQRIV